MKSKHSIEALFCLGVKIILRNQDNKILVLKLDKTITSANCSCKNGCWELPGGRVQVGEDELGALHREIIEETGITKLENIRPIMMIRSDYKMHIDGHDNVGLIFSIFHGTVENDTVSLSSDHVDYAWVDETQAIQLLGKAYGKDFHVLLSASNI